MNAKFSESICPPLESSGILNSMLVAIKHSNDFMQIKTGKSTAVSRSTKFAKEEFVGAIVTEKAGRDRILERRSPSGSKYNLLDAQSNALEDNTLC